MVTSSNFFINVLVYYWQLLVHEISELAIQFTIKKDEKLPK